MIPYINRIIYYFISSFKWITRIQFWYTNYSRIDDIGLTVEFFVYLQLKTYIKVFWYILLLKLSVFAKKRLSHPARKWYDYEQKVFYRIRFFKRPSNWNLYSLCGKNTFSHLETQRFMNAHKTVGRGHIMRTKKSQWNNLYSIIAKISEFPQELLLRDMGMISQNALELILPIVPLRFSCIYSVDLPPAVENFPVVSTL